MTSATHAVLEAGDVWLVPTYWRQCLSSADREHPIQDEKCLSFHAKARWFENWNWFADNSLCDILFEIDVLSEAMASRRKGEMPAEWKGTIGGLRYIGESQDDATGELYRSFVHGIVSVSNAVFEELWERVKLRLALPCDVSLEVHGLEIDMSPGLRDRWDVKKQPKLKVLRVEFRFAIGEPLSIVGSSTLAKL